MHVYQLYFTILTLFRHFSGGNVERCFNPALSGRNEIKDYSKLELPLIIHVPNGADSEKLTFMSDSLSQDCYYV